jgi:hypothetical protein
MSLFLEPGGSALEREFKELPKWGDGVENKTTGRIKFWGGFALGVVSWNLVWQTRRLLVYLGVIG